MICELDTSNLEIAGDRVKSSRSGWTEYGVNAASSFYVYGMGVFQRKLRFLIDLSENGRPLWLDATDFKLLASDVPSDWVSASFEGDWSFVVGYRELVQSEAHFNGLLEREEQDLALFHRIKMAYQKQELNNP